jgi:hypothetical protein
MLQLGGGQQAAGETAGPAPAPAGQQEASSSRLLLIDPVKEILNLTQVVQALERANMALTHQLDVRIPCLQASYKS